MASNENEEVANAKYPDSNFKREQGLRDITRPKVGQVMVTRPH